MVGLKRKSRPRQTSGGDKQHAKKLKQGKQGKGAQSRKHQSQHQHVELPHDLPDEAPELTAEDEALVDEYDFSFLDTMDREALDRELQQPRFKKAKGRPEPPAAGGGSASDNEQSPELEERYERAPRQRLQEQKAAAQPEQGGLPVKTLEGEVVPQLRGVNLQAAVAAVPGVVVEEGMPAEGTDDEGEPEAAEPPQPAMEGSIKQRRDSAEATQEAGSTDDDGPDDLQDFQDAEERREELKQRMAVTASQLLADPERHLPSIKLLLELARDSDAQVQRLALLSLLAVFQDILPAYRIRPPTEKELQVQVSREVQRVRDYEAMQLRCYQVYLKQLLAVSKQKSAPADPVAAQTARVAVRCMAGLLAAHPHFNFSGDLLQAVVPLLASRDAQLRQLCSQAVQDLLAADQEGAVACEAVQLIADLVKRCNCVCPPEAVRLLLVLRLTEASANDVGNPAKGQRKMSKNQKKKRRGQDAVDEAFAEAEAGLDAKARRQQHSAMLEALFEIFFRVLKHCAAASRQQGVLSVAGARKRFPLLSPTLEGLARFAHLISVDYFGDLMQVLQQVLAFRALPLAERLRCLLTASEILTGQGEALTVDRQELYQQLQETIPELLLQPLMADAEWRAVPDAAPEGGKQQQRRERPAGVLLAQVAQQLLVQQAKGLDTNRLAGFVKELGCAALELETGDALGSLALMNRLLRRNMRLRGMLEHEAGTPQLWAAPDTARTGPSAAAALAGAPLWELALLRKHYHPHVAQSAAVVAAIPPEGSSGGGSHGPLASAQEPATIAAAYSTVGGAFNPPPTGPKKRHPSKRKQAGPSTALQAASEDLLGNTSTGIEAASLEQQAVLDAVGAQLQQHFRSCRHFSANEELRQQAQTQERQIRLLRDHLKGSTGKGLKSKPAKGKPAN